MTALQMVGFDADDTLWHSETYYQDAQAQFESLLARYIDVGDARVRERLLATERANLRLFGYGAKGMTLSMIETAIALTEARIDGADIHRVTEIGKSVLQHPVELLPGVREAVAAVAARHRGGAAGPVCALATPGGEDGLAVVAPFDPGYSRERYLVVFTPAILLGAPPAERREGDVLTSPTLEWIGRRDENIVNPSPFGRLRITVAPASLPAAG